MKKKVMLAVMERSYASVTEEMCNLLVEAEKIDYHSDLEPWEAYEKKTKALLHENSERFRKRFVAGYEKLMDTMEPPERKVDDPNILRP